MPFLSLPKAWGARIKDMITSGEVIEFAIAEHRLASKYPLAPAILLGTNKRIIITRIGVLRLHKKYVIIKYSDIVDVELERGLIFSRVHLGLQNEPPNIGEKKWMDGLQHDGALELVSFVEKMRQGPAKRLNE